MSSETIRKIYRQQLKELDTLSREIAKTIENADSHSLLKDYSQKLTQKIRSLKELETLIQETEQKLLITQRFFQQSEEKFSKTFNLGPVIITLSTITEGRYVEVSDYFLRMTEYTRDEVIGHTSFELGVWVNLKDRARIMQALKDVGKVGDEEILFRSRSGKMYTMLFFAEVVFMGDVAYVVSVAIDITERKRSEEALRVSEERYRGILEEMEEAYYEVDLEGRFTFFNPSISRTYGYTEDEIMGASYMTAMDMDKDNIEKVFKAFHQVYVTGETIKGIDWRLKHKNGRVIHVEASASLRRDSHGNPIGFKGITRDITERKKAEELLEESEKRFRSLFQKSLDIIIMMDGNGLITYETPSVENILGYLSGYLIGKSPLDLIHPDDLQEVATALNAVYFKSNPGTATEFRFRKADGTWVHLEAIGQNLLEDPSIHGVVITARDITERKRAEEALKESEANYRQLFDNAPAAIYRIDFKTGKFVKANDVLCGYLGVSREEITSFSPYDLLTEESKKLFLERVEKMALGIEVPDIVEYEWFDKDGRQRCVLLQNKMIYDAEGRIIASDVVAHDITERKRAEDALLLTQFAMDRAPESILLVDDHGNLKYANYAACTSLGYTREELLSMQVFDIDPDFPIEGWEQHKKELKHLGKMTFEGRHRTKDGRLFPVEVTSNYLEYKGRFLSIAFDRDITERKRAEEALRASEERYRTIFERTATANIIIAEDTTILMVNNYFSGMSGYTKQELEGKISWTAFVHKDDLERMKNYHKMRRLILGSAPSSYEFRFINRQGEIREIIMSVSMIPETKDSVASMIDITEWKRSEQAKIESEARFKELAELLPESVYEADENGFLTFMNLTGFEKTGYTQADLSRGISIFDIIIPEDQARMMATYQRLMKGEHVGLGEYTTRKKDGHTFPALFHSTAILRDGKPVGHRGFIVDISEKKGLENQLLRAQKMEAIGTLAGGIAHDFNNLLMGILGNISLILLQVDQKHPIHDRLKHIEGYVQRGSDLTKQLLGFARGGKYEVKPTDLVEFIRESSELFGRTKKEIHIHHKTQAGLWGVEVDQGQMEQVLLNLYVNAWHAMPHGGDLFLSEENVELDSVNVSPYEIPPGKFVKVTITDTGTGMDDATKARVFEPFFTTKERGRGTGLGLASAYGIIKNHGGFMHVESEKGIGTSFMIYLPASDKDVVHDQKVEEKLHKGRETVLLIDDEEMILDVSASMLEELGYRVMVASGGMMGVHMYEQNRENIDLVILDMIMPDCGGSKTFDALIRINPSVKVLLSSGYSIDSQAKEILQKGCKGFIQKPFNLIDLSKKIRDIFDKQ